MKSYFFRDSSNKNPEFFESVCLYAFLACVVGLSIYIVLPAYQDIGRSFGISEAVELQKNVLLFIVGMFFGELVSGYAADMAGRKKTVACSVLIFIIGAALCFASHNHALLLGGRFIQGIGAAGVKIAIRAVIADRYKGRDFARLSSFILALYVFVSFVAPTLGEALSDRLGWRWIFAFLGAFSLAGVAWFLSRHEETLAPENRNAAGIRAVLPVLTAFLSNIKAMGYTTIAGLLFGVHLAFISLSSLMFRDMYGIEEMFPVYFGVMSSAFGLALFLNGKLVVKYGMHFMTMSALSLMILLGIVSILVSVGDRAPGLAVFFGLIFSLLFCIGIVFGNIGALAMETLGKVAGLGAALSSAISTLIAVGVSYLVGAYYDGGLVSFAVGTLACAAASLAICIVAWQSRVEVISYGQTEIK